MNSPTNTPLSLALPSVSRRSFLHQSGTALAATSLAGLPSILRGVAPDQPLKLALVGCGGRGAGAANQALRADSNLRLVAAADLFEDKLANGLKALHAQHGDRADIPQTNRFVGFDAYKKAIALADVVILGSPCAFRPAHFEEAVRLGKHAFLEKPVAVDAPGVRRVLAAAAEAKKKNLKVAVGFQRRHKRGFQEMVRRIHNGQIGEVLYTRAFANTPLRTGLIRKSEMSELEYQCRNWYYFSWLSGDFIVDNLIHGIDISNWIHGSYPIKAHGMGALSERSPDYGNLFDHFSVEWEYASGGRLFGECDRRTGCWASVSNHAVGSEGKADFLDGRELYSLTGKKTWQTKSERGENPYQQHHNDWFEAIRKDLPFDETEYGAKSTLTAIMGRMAAYSGKIIDWEAAFNSTLSLAPDISSMQDAPPVTPDAQGLYAIPIAGKSVAF